MKRLEIDKKARARYTESSIAMGLTGKFDNFEVNSSFNSQIIGCAIRLSETQKCGERPNSKHETLGR